MLRCAFLRLTQVFLLLASTITGATQTNTLFRSLPASRTGISFNNKLRESDTLNILNQANIYNGGGVGLADFNRDGLIDVYLAGNMVPNRLYLNKGALAFKDVSVTAGVGGEGRWCTGVSVVDINADGWPDLYVSASFLKEPQQRRNLLYINQGADSQGIPRFKEEAASYGIDDPGFSTQGVFLDFDRDGDLDLYIVTNELNDPKTPIRYRPKVNDGSALNTDRLYRNNGNGTFSNVSKEAGITIEGWGHAVCISDVNLDGWPDIYVSNDFISNDLLYINNQDGTFTNRAAEYFRHTAWNAMGSDMVDINNDGYPDLVSLEMLPERNLRKKTMLRGDEYFNYFNSRQYGYEHQYVRNVLQLNSGRIPGKHPVFSDVAFMAGVFETDWSWAPLIADFDNDGFRDLIISNGLPRDVTDLDYISYDNGQGGSGANNTLGMVDSLPVVKIANYSFRNKGGFLFENTTRDWGLQQPAFSNGAAYGDLDNDGDMDLVINNINDPAFVYENTLMQRAAKKPLHYLSVILEGPQKNTAGTGAKIRVYHSGSKSMLYEHNPCRGYLSTMDARAHFGLGDVVLIDSIRVIWPDGKSQLMKNIKADARVTLSYKDAAENEPAPGIPEQPALLGPVSGKYGISYRHTEKDAIDYNIQPTLPHKLSQYGPGLAVGDIDNNGQDDVYIGGSAGNHGVFLMQDNQGRFTLDSNRIFPEGPHPEEDMGVLLFDADNDRDLDLYMVSGSYEYQPYDRTAQDRLYLNDGSGKFTRAISALPREFSNGSCVRAADIDADGDLDLFVGGRSVSGSYPLIPQSYIFRNNGGVFADVTQEFCPDLQSTGMITDALWSDFDKDGKVDLVVTGEWMPVSFFRNMGDSLVPLRSSGISTHLGWWNSLVSGDFDNDGDMDYVAGNLGLNSHFKATAGEPMSLYAKDLDENGKLDLMIFCYMRAEDGTRKPFPMHTRDDMISQLVSIRKKYPTFKAYGLASLDNLWTRKDREGAITMQANDLHSSFIENKGNGQFAIRTLPPEAQVAPVYGMVSKDVDGDGNLDLLLVGNDYGMEPSGGRHDAFNGLCMKGDGKGYFTCLTPAESGFFVNGDAKGLGVVHSASGQDLFFATQNLDSLLVFEKKTPARTRVPKTVALEWDDFCADISYRNNTRRRVEFYYGSTFLSQSSRLITWEENASTMTITKFNGQKREVTP